MHLASQQKMTRHPPFVKLCFAQAAVLRDLRLR